MPNTPILALPYPVSTDTADVPRDIAALANKLDTTVVTRPALVSVLPGSPTDGQEIYFQNAAMATDGVVWHLRYRAGSGSAYKWEFLGGQAFGYSVETQELSGATTFAYFDLTTVGPQITLPLAGDYVAAWGCAVIPTANLSAAYMALGYGTAWTVPASRYIDVQLASANGSVVNTAAEQRLNGIAAATLLKARYYTANANANYFAGRYLHVTPVRLG